MRLTKGANGMRYEQILTDDFNNGPGLRVSLWTRGCPHRCPGCHNPHLFNKTGGKEFTEETMERLLSAIKEDIPRDFSVLGGEPLAPYNIQGVVEVCRRVRETYPSISIWLWSGYTWRDIASDPNREEVLKYIDVLVDGRFMQNQMDSKLEYRGSRNQRIIDVQKTLTTGHIVLYQE